MHSRLTRRQALTALGTAAVATTFGGGQISAAEEENELGRVLTSRRIFSLTL
jgi:hypothetical protein